MIFFKRNLFLLLFIIFALFAFSFELIQRLASAFRNVFKRVSSFFYSHFEKVE